MRRPGQINLLTTLLLLGAATATEAQEIIARAERVEIHEFRSPMELDLPANDLRSLEPGDSFSFGDGVRNFVCDDVYIWSLALQRHRISRGKLVRFSIKGYLFVRPGYDREVTLKFSLLLGDEVLRTVPLPRREAEEKKRRFFSGPLILTKEDHEASLSSGQQLTLRVEMEVFPD